MLLFNRKGIQFILIMEFRKGKEEMEIIAALHFLKSQAFFELGILNICLSVSKRGGGGW